MSLSDSILIKKCACCKETKSITEFRIIPTRDNRPISYCFSCERSKARGYDAKRRGIPVKDIPFLTKVDITDIDIVALRLEHNTTKSGDCLLWNGPYNKQGYGMISCHWYGGKRSMYAHRLAYLVENGVIDNRALVRHSCHTPACINPRHLMQGTTKDNRNDCVLAGRQAKGERNGGGNSGLTVDDVRLIRSLYEQGTWTQSALGKSYHVSQYTIYRIVNRHGWKHVA